MSFNPVFMTALLAVLTSLRVGSLPVAGTRQSPAALAPSAAVGFLSPADFLHKEQRWNLRFASGFPYPPQLTKVKTEMLSLLNVYKFITKPFASLGQSLLLH